MGNPFITGETVYLRALEEDDLDGDYLKWLNDPEVNTYMTAGLIPQSRTMLKKFYESISSDTNSIYFAIVDKKTGGHIGNVKLDKIDRRNGRCEFGILIGDRGFWGKGICREVARLMAGYAFTKLNLRKVSVGAIETNTAAIKCYESAGFMQEGRLRAMHFDQTKGKYVDHIWFGMLRSEWEAASKTKTKAKK